jgi:hypothetical protein
VTPREQRGRLVRETWVRWARQQPSPKPGWLTGWNELDYGQRQVDMLIGEAVAADTLLTFAAELEAGAAQMTEMAGAPREALAVAVSMARERAQALAEGRP